ncbi:hypothetical protein [Pseudooceanicola sp.]|uniref:hypothetical protein n=1 Tax=Pseudooceanicola sp. TaxID=1914328 RepID=UPI00351897CC
MSHERIHDLTGRERSVEDIMRDAERLQTGGGGPYDPGMEQRVANLENRMNRVEAKLDAINERTARMDGEISRLPGYGGIALVVGLIVGLSTAAQIAASLLPAATP